MTKQHGKTARSGGEHDLEIERVVDAPRNVVYEAWTHPDCMAQWPAPHGFLITHATGDVRPGGVWRSCMRSPEGEDLWLGGTYREVVPNEQLSFTHAWDADGSETLVTIELEDDGRGTRMSFRQTGFDSKEARDSHRGGWTEAFERLDELLSHTLHTGPKIGRRPPART